MVNKSQKGSRMEKLCLEELNTWISQGDGGVIATWKVKRGGGTFARFQGGNDFLDGYDIALLTNQNVLILVQVKSKYGNAEIQRLRKIVPNGSLCYLAVYSKSPKHYDIKLPHFYLVKV